MYANLFMYVWFFIFMSIFRVLKWKSLVLRIFLKLKTVGFSNSNRVWNLPGWKGEMSPVCHFLVQSWWLKNEGGIKLKSKWSRPSAGGMNLLPVSEHTFRNGSWIGISTFACTLSLLGEWKPEPSFMFTLSPYSQYYVHSTNSIFCNKKTVKNS